MIAAERGTSRNTLDAYACDLADWATFCRSHGIDGLHAERAHVDLYALDLDPSTLAALAQHAENAYVGVPCGRMDQTAIMLARPGHALFLDTRSGDHEDLPFDPGAHGIELLAVDTGARHSLADGSYAERRAECEQAALRLGLSSLRDVEPDPELEVLSRLDDPTLRRRARHVVTENARVLRVAAMLADGRLEAIGPLLTASHESLRDDFEVSSPELDTAVSTALAHGALGARMTGAGFGGSVVIAAPAAHAENIRDAVLAELGRQHGSLSATASPASPSGGARRE